MNEHIDKEVDGNSPIKTKETESDGDEAITEDELLKIKEKIKLIEIERSKFMHAEIDSKT